MAGFLPQVDKLQALLKDEMSFKNKLEMAKMGKSRQLAEVYLPALSKAKNVNEVTEIQQALITEAAKYGIDDILPKVNSVFEGKKYQLTEKDKEEKLKAKYNTLLGTYGHVNMYNNYRGSNTTGIQFMNDWFEYSSKQGIDPLSAVDDLENSIKQNLFETSTEAAAVGNDVIVVRKRGKTKLGGDISSQSIAFKYDARSNLLYEDKNQNNKIDEGELAPESVMYEPEVQKQMQTLYNKEQKEIDNRIAEAGIAATYAGIADSAANRSFQQALASKIDVNFTIGARQLSQGIETLKGAKFSSKAGTQSYVLGNILGIAKDGEVTDAVRANLAKKYGITQDDVNRIIQYNPESIMDKTTGEYSNKIESYFNTVDKFRKFLVEYANTGVEGISKKEFSVLAEQLDYAVKVYQSSLTPGKGLAANVYQPVTIWGREAMQFDDNGNPKDQSKTNSWVAETTKGNERKTLEMTGYDFSGNEIKWNPWKK